MKTTLKALSGILLLTAMYSCKKSEIKLTPLASVNLTNAVINAPTIYMTASDSVTAGSNGIFGFSAGQSNLKVYAGNQIYYNQSINAANGSYYSLFLSGLSTSAVDAIYIKESYKNYTDSLCGVRFINLSPDSNPISVDIAGLANGSEVSTLAYKAHTGFKQYPATLAASSYNFEVRDAATGNLLTTYTLNTPYFHNVTLALNRFRDAGNNGNITGQRILI